MKYIVVDCENVSYKIVKPMMDIPDTRFVFVEGAGQSTELYRELNPYETVKCPSRGKNAADFVVISVVTEILTRAEDNIVLILSNDTGFDPAIGYLNLRGLCVARVTTKEEVESKNIIVYRNQKQSMLIEQLTEANLELQTQLNAEKARSGSYKADLNRKTTQFKSETDKLNSQVLNLNNLLSDKIKIESELVKKINDLNSELEIERTKIRVTQDALIKVADKNNREQELKQKMAAFYRCVLINTKNSMSEVRFTNILYKEFGSNVTKYIEIALNDRLIKILNTKYGSRVYFKKDELDKEINRLG